jgi:hypothetical protein
MRHGLRPHASEALLQVVNLELAAEALKEMVDPLVDLLRSVTRWR